MKFTGTNEEKPQSRSESPRLVEPDFLFRVLDWELTRAERFWETFVLAIIEADPSAQAVMESTLTRCIRRCDLASRIAGERFAVLLIRARREVLPAFAERLRQTLRELGGELCEIHIGAASYPTDGSNANALLAAAEAALQKAKTGGTENAYSLYQAKAPSASPRPRILIIDDDAQNRKLLRTFLRSLDYEVEEAEGGEQGLALLQCGEFDLVLLDVMMPGINGFEVCRRLKSREPTRLLPVILVTALNDTQSKIEGIKAGADDFLTKPFHFEELSARTASLIRLKKINNNMASVESVLMSLAAAIEAKDRYTQGHTDRAARLAMNVGLRLALSDEEVNCLRIGGILHDVGKIGVPESILNKEGPLTEEEWKIMKTHPELGYRICESLSRTLGLALEVIRHHHEKLDGSAYPDGLKGKEVSMVSRIMGVVDIYDALITDRPYRKALSEQQAIEILRQEAAEGKLDLRVVEALVQEVQR